MLRQLPVNAHPDLIVGAEHFSDAGVFRLREDCALVQTTDFFPPLVDDPRAFGQIAAANSLSDCYAMGGRPITALNIVAFPDKELPAEILVEILAGGCDKVHEAGAVIVGGHSIRDVEIKYGLAVTGLVDPRRLIMNNAAQPGDALILTKPIGSGTLTTAAKKELIPESDLAECIAVMSQLNRAASEAMLACGTGVSPVSDRRDTDPTISTHAATDITGFGLIGHAYEMAEASGVTLRIIASQVPLMTHAHRLAKQGCLTRVHKATLEHVGPALRVEGVDEVLVSLLADAQTSGGLLISTSEPDRLLAEMKSRSVSAAFIGTVHPRGDAIIHLVN